MYKNLQSSAEEEKRELEQITSQFARLEWDYYQKLAGWFQNIAWLTLIGGGLLLFIVILQAARDRSIGTDTLIAVLQISLPCVLSWILFQALGAHLEIMIETERQQRLNNVLLFKLLRRRKTDQPPQSE